MKKLAIITSHPIQYNAPFFRLLSNRKKMILKVFYTWGQAVNSEIYDPEFGKSFMWDIPLLEGYEYEAIENVSSKPGANHFWGIQNRDLLNRIDAFMPDALLVFGWSFSSHLQVLRKYYGKKLILFRGDSTLLDEHHGFNIKKAIRRIFLKWIYRHIDIAIYTGSANKEYYIKHNLKEIQLKYVPHAVENDRFNDFFGIYQEQVYLLRQQLLIPDDAFVFLFAGKFEAKKDPKLLLEAFKLINNDQVYLVLVGNGVLENELKRLVNGKSNVRFLEFQNQQKMPLVYRLGDVFVLPSKGPGESWGLAINEAMACGKAILASDRCGAATDLVRNGYNGYVFRSGDRDDLIEKMQICISDIPSVKKMGEISREMIKEWSYEKGCKIIESLLNSEEQQEKGK